MVTDAQMILRKSRSWNRRAGNHQSIITKYQLWSVNQDAHHPKVVPWALCELHSCLNSHNLLSGRALLDSVLLLTIPYNRRPAKINKNSRIGETILHVAHMIGILVPHNRIPANH